jgi:hypothetical protein
MSAKLTITIPEWLDKICAWPAVEYRKLKYGYSFRRIYLGEGEWTIVDQADYYLYGNLRWSARGKGWGLYAVRDTKTEPGLTKMVYLHREIMNEPEGLLVDHRNNNGLDNRRSNLRLATHYENTCNRRKTKAKTTSRFIGVYFEKRTGRWVAQIRHRGKKIVLGRFKSEEEAARAYDEAAKKYHGEFARLNFPD